MYRRLIVISAIILAALCGLALLGYHSVNMWAEGLEGARLAQFARAAETIRSDVKNKLDDFLQTEQRRPYTHYQYYYVPDDYATQQVALIQSPLSGKLDNGLAYGNFQVDSVGNVLTPNDYLIAVDNSQSVGQQAEFYTEVLFNRKNIEENVVPAINTMNLAHTDSPADRSAEIANALELSTKTGPLAKADVAAKSAKGRGPTASLPIGSLTENQDTQVYRQRRSVVATNTSQMEADTEQVEGQMYEEMQQRQYTDRAAQQQIAPINADTPQIRYNQAGGYGQAAESTQGTSPPNQRPAGGRSGSTRQAPPVDSVSAGPPNSPALQQALQMRDGMYTPTEAPMTQPQQPMQQQAKAAAEDTVEVRVEPFTPIVVPNGDDQTIFGGQVFLVRNVTVEDKQLVQGFQLNEKELIREVTESAGRVVSLREGMDFELPQTKSQNAQYAGAEYFDADNNIAYTAILDFGFGYLVMNLKEIDPGRIGRQVAQLKFWYFAIIVTVLLAVTLALASLWRNANAQLKLARKKDDFISAVSHELRTPLTSIRMYSEMLEKNWVKSPQKRDEYYRNMRQESERLTRLIENVLDFSRIQRGRKKYAFAVGDINECVADVVEMMRPYAAQAGFEILTEFGQLGPTAFDRDAVTQIVVNLLDNAVKYARDAADKTIIVRTTRTDGSVYIDVEDHGPGVPPRQRSKVFEEFYRCGPEATRETTGTGLGLALVRKFAQAHEGFVEITSAKPTGAVFRVALRTSN